MADGSLAGCGVEDGQVGYGGNPLSTDRHRDSLMSQETTSNIEPQKCRR